MAQYNMNTTILLLVSIAALMHASWNFVARKYSGDFIILWLGVVVGAFFLLPVALGTLIYEGGLSATATKGFLYVLASGVIHAIYFALLSRAYQAGEISLVYPVARGSGIALTAVFATFLFSEQMSWHGALGIIIILLGILGLGGMHLFHPQNKKAFLLALAVGGSITTYSLIDKIGVRYLNPFIYISVMFFLTALFWLPRVLQKHTQRIKEIKKQSIVHILIIGIGSILTYLLILFAFQLGQVNYIVALRESSIVIGALMGIIFLNERFSISKIVAILVILLGLIIIPLKL